MNEDNDIPLIKKLENPSMFSNQKFIERIPNYIVDNLKHDLRTYQKHAIQNLDYVEHIDSDIHNYDQLLFYMATGSGKTDIMASIILYMYKEFGYQCFLFTVSSNAVINKTKDNLINKESFKYLYNNSINIDGKNIIIKEVSIYPDILEEGVIYILLSSIQTLSSMIYSPKENGISEYDLSKQKLVILADEAHHFNVQTKSNKKNIENKNWETLLSKIRGLNHNKQFEFTATLNFSDEKIYKKYFNKTVFKYDLSQFINQGYSKKVYKLQANNDDNTKMLNAILLSQYRKNFAYDLGIQNFKPVLLFKSNKISVSNSAEKKFLELINNLDADKLNLFIHRQKMSTESHALSIVYNYYSNKNTGILVNELKRDFTKQTEINANDSSSKGIMDAKGVYKKLNTLESPENPIRVIFAVAKLSEGWDVLNLYDIVRINENHNTLTETNAEAQLIGRGARYNPFKYDNKNSYMRRFDKSATELQLLERLYYHTINEPKYLENLRKSLDAIDLPVQDDVRSKYKTVSVKDSFKNTDVYKMGKVYYNDIETIPDDYYNSLSKYGIDVYALSPVDMVDSTIERNYEDSSNTNDTFTSICNIASFKSYNDKALIRTSMSRNKFYRFSNIKKYCPKLKSINEFLTSDNWLGNAIIKAKVYDGLEELDPLRKLEAVDKYLSNIEYKIKKNFSRKKGSNIFRSLPIKNIVNDYKKAIPFTFNYTNQIIKEKSMKNHSWYVYDKAIVNKLERSFIEALNSFMPTIFKKYKDAYLIRIDENFNSFKLHDFGYDITEYRGYMPDFILYLKNSNYIYQVYLEPKGDQLLEKDNWKQNLLEKINPNNIELIGDNKNVRLYGVKFFISGDRRHIFKEMKEKGIII